MWLVSNAPKIGWCNIPLHSLTRIGQFSISVNACLRQFSLKLVLESYVSDPPASASGTGEGMGPKPSLWVLVRDWHFRCLPRLMETRDFSPLRLDLLCRPICTGALVFRGLKKQPTHPARCVYSRHRPALAFPRTVNRAPVVDEMSRSEQGMPGCFLTHDCSGDKSLRKLAASKLALAVNVSARDRITHPLIRPKPSE
jgi:hypothetical protein